MKNKTAHSLIIIGCVVAFATAALHWIGAYPRLSASLGASNLAPHLSSALRSVFLLVGWDWLAIAIIALIATFSGARPRKAIIVFCSVALLVSVGIVFHFVGWFIGNEMLAAAGAFMLAGALLLD